jgi:hypothetical protein
MRTPTFRERLRYRFDAFMSRGTLALILGLFAISALMILGVSFVITLLGEVTGAMDRDDLTFLDIASTSCARVAPGSSRRAIPSSSAGASRSSRSSRNSSRRTPTSAASTS